MSRSLLLVLVVALACVAGVSANMPAEAMVASEALLADAALVQQGEPSHVGLESKFNTTDANGWVLYKQVRAETYTDAHGQRRTRGKGGRHERQLGDHQKQRVNETHEARTPWLC